jgi:hypothetical protein
MLRKRIAIPLSCAKLDEPDQEIIFALYSLRQRKGWNVIRLAQLEA